MQCDKCLNNKENVCIAEWDMCTAQYEHCFGFESKETYEKGKADGAREFAEWFEENSYEYIDSFWQGHSIGEALEDYEKEQKE